jgi:hypothetical protein
MATTKTLLLLYRSGAFKVTNMALRDKYHFVEAELPRLTFNQSNAALNPIERHFFLKQECRDYLIYEED